MNCANCGAAVSEGALACPQCGQRTLGAAEADAYLLHMARNAKKVGRALRRAGESRQILLAIEQEGDGSPKNAQRRRLYNRHIKRYQENIAMLGGGQDGDWHERA
jgi:hypothetical protein